MTDNLSLADIAAVTDREHGYDGMWGGGGSLWVIIFLIFAMMGGGFGGFGARGCAPAGEPVTEAGLCSAMNFNNLENAVGRLNDNQAAIARQTDNAIAQIGYQNAQLSNQTQRDLCQGFASTVAAINQARFDNQSCCCETQKTLEGVNYNISQSAAAINANTAAQTQKILDAIACNRMADMQNQINQLQLQSALCGVVRYPVASTYSAGCGPFFGSQCCGSYNI